MKFKALTIKDIALALGLSFSTVSKALRDSHEISEETKKLVVQYAAKHNYKPNPIAQSLKQSRSKAIGVIVCNIDNTFFSQVINGIESVAHKKDYHVIISQSHESYELEVKSVHDIASRSVDGLLISLSAETKDYSHISEVHEQGLPVVFFDRVTDAITTHQVVSDNFDGAYKATLHLIQKGFKKVAHLTSSNSLSITAERLNGYKKALLDSGLPVDDNYIQYCQHGGMIDDEVEKALHQLLQLPQPPDALFAASDRLSTKTLALLHQLKLRVPQDIALMGFTNAATAAILNPSLSCIVQPAYEMGKEATERLIQIIESKRPITQFDKVVFLNELFIRDSTGNA